MKIGTIIVIFLGTLYLCCNNNESFDFEKQQIYLTEYHDNNLAVIERTKDLTNRGIIKDGDKIIKDFNRINVAQVTPGDDNSVTAITENNLINIMICIFCVGIAFRYFDERKRGMWNFVYSTVRGREQLALRRMWTGIVEVSIVTILGFLAVIIATWMILGVPDFYRSIQSIECFGQLPYALNVLEFLILFGIMKVLGAVVVFLVIFVIFSLVNDRNLATLITVLIVSIEVLLYIVIKPNSNWEFLKNINIYSFTFGTQDFTLYKNYMLLGIAPVYRMEARTIGLVLVIVGLTVTGALINYFKRPTRETPLIEVIVGNRVIGRIIGAIPNWLAECRKQLLFCGGIIILSCVIAAGVMVNPKNPTQYKTSNSRLRLLYQECNGDIEVAHKLLDELKQELEECQESDNYRKNMLIEDMRSFESRIGFIEGLHSAGYKVPIIDEKAYVIYFNRASMRKIGINMLIVIAGMILLYSNLFTYENGKNTLLLVNSTAKGRQKLLCHKIIFALAMFAVMSFFTIGIYNINFNYDYGFLDFNEAAMTISTLARVLVNVPASYTIGDAVVALNCIIMAVLLAAAVIIFILAKMVGYKKTMLISVMFLELPLIYMIWRC